MKHLIYATLAALALAGAAVPLAAQDRSAIPGVARDQLGAFRAGDLAGAKAFASPTGFVA
ncbi:hypothetical protein Q4543_05220 [Salipiger sp. 1_MG-2023]|uniref:hypothetical protein n=1 Tax=Salipiger sp. 1_MG-2023 TaxID=3062665 RepID=UPI0026E274C3|nr:hypothetical protein [Salipiger sp. 1_MG-2023]MDO6584911.1 hypothetical protein [Salipiger sp. 1_MG-2023]